MIILFSLNSLLPIPLLFLVFLSIVEESTSWLKTHVWFFRPDHRQWQRLSLAASPADLEQSQCTTVSEGHHSERFRPLWPFTFSTNSTALEPLFLGLCLRPRAEVSGEDGETLKITFLRFDSYLFKSLKLSLRPLHAKEFFKFTFILRVRETLH